MTELDLDERIDDIFTVAPEYRVNHIKQLIRDCLGEVTPDFVYRQGADYSTGHNDVVAYVIAKTKELLG